MTQTYNVIVIGGGHAGIEAALAASRLGCKTLLCTMDSDKIGFMSCNPSIGGPAKGQIVGEIDALGGEMGHAADKTQLQLKVLNRSRGPAVQCLRAQSDKPDYNIHMRNLITNTPNITIESKEVFGLIFEEKTVIGITLSSGEERYADAVVITSGTFLKGRMHTGLTQTIGGRIFEQSAESLSDSLIKHFRMGRLKTGTPPRLDHHSIDYSQALIQPGDPEFLRFSFRTDYSSRYEKQIPCYLTRTTEETHNIILNNLDRSPMYTNVIKGVGPRYCPSIEDKVVRFREKDSHQIFIEPEDKHHSLIYPGGLNTSLPDDVQAAFLKTMPGFQEAKIITFGYAVEYDFVFPDQLKPTLETKEISGLFLAGQINGTSGYEEAAGQGIIAGINAGLKSQNRPPFILSREESFIGTLIDDLITKNIYEPYRMMTSRSEYRLLLRQDNATFRLSEKAYEIGLLSDENIHRIREQRKEIQNITKTWATTSITDEQVKTYNTKQKLPIKQWIKRPEISIETLLKENIISASQKEVAEKAIVEIKYEGYIKKQEQEIQKIKKFETKQIPPTLDFSALIGLKKESRDQLIKFKPKTIYEAQRIAGINPADIMILIGYMERIGRTTSEGSAS